MLTREAYKAIKNMNRQEMDSYLSHLKAQSYNDGISAVSKEIAQRVDDGIRNTPGIGEKRYTELITNINKELNKDKEAAE